MRQRVTMPSCSSNCNCCGPEKDVYYIGVSTKEGEPPSEQSCKAKIAQNQCVVVTLFFVSVIIGILSIVLDWLWVYDMATAYKALVFGPPTTPQYALMCFIAIFGTVAFMLEISNQMVKRCRGKAFMAEPVEQLISLFLEEVPQVTLNWLLASCHEMPSNWIALAKATIAIISGGVRVLKVLIYMCRCQGTRTRKRCRGFYVGARWIILITCCYTFAGGIIAWLFTYSSPPPITEDGADAGFKAPPAVLGLNYHGDRYFDNAGVFFSHPHFQHCNAAADRTGSENVTQNWIQMEHIYTFLDLKNSDPDYVESVYAYNDSHSIFWIRSPQQESCFQTVLETCDIQRLTNQSICPHHSLDNNQTRIIFRFVHKKRFKTLVFGDIQFNAAIQVGANCSDLQSDEWGSLHYHGNQYGQVQYFQAKGYVNTSHPFYQTSGAMFRHYTYDFDYFNDGELYNVSGVWKTGYNQCEMSGSPCPNPNRRLETLCPMPKPS